VKIQELCNQQTERMITSYRTIDAKIDGRDVGLDTAPTGQDLEMCTRMRREMGIRNLGIFAILEMDASECQVMSHLWNFTGQEYEE
jgi:hypothetical protein